MRRGGDARGSAEDRRRRRQFLLDTFGDGETAPCYRCGDVLDVETLTVDRRIPGVLGGTYRRENIRPACGPCQSKTGNYLRWATWPELRFG